MPIFFSFLKNQKEKNSKQVAMTNIVCVMTLEFSCASRKREKEKEGGRERETGVFQNIVAEVTLDWMKLAKDTFISQSPETLTSSAAANQPGSK